jgi:hypothetical protein
MGTMGVVLPYERRTTTLLRVIVNTRSCLNAFKKPKYATTTRPQQRQYPTNDNVHPTDDVTAFNRQFQSLTRCVRRERGVRARQIIASLDALPHVFIVVVKIHTSIPN